MSKCLTSFFLFRISETDYGQYAFLKIGGFNFDSFPSVVSSDRGIALGYNY